MLIFYLLCYAAVLINLPMCLVYHIVTNTIYKDCFIKVYYKRQQNTCMHVLLDNDCSVRAYQSFVAIFQTYFLSCLINAFSDLLCSKLCWHNRLVPTTI